jgi:hypothetical protein
MASVSRRAALSHYKKDERVMRTDSEILASGEITKAEMLAILHDLERKGLIYSPRKNIGGSLTATWKTVRITNCFMPTSWSWFA